MRQKSAHIAELMGTDFLRRTVRSRLNPHQRAQNVSAAQTAGQGKERSTE
jgi:hypothetical protein